MPSCTRRGMSRPAATAILLLLALILISGVAAPACVGTSDIAKVKLPAALRQMALALETTRWDAWSLEAADPGPKPAYRGALLVRKTQSGYFAVIDFGGYGVRAFFFEESAGSWSSRCVGSLAWEQRDARSQTTPGHAAVLPPVGSTELHLTSGMLWGVLPREGADITAVYLTRSEDPRASPVSERQVEGRVFCVPVWSDMAIVEITDQGTVTRSIAFAEPERAPSYGSGELLARHKLPALRSIEQAIGAAGGEVPSLTPADAATLLLSPTATGYFAILDCGRSGTWACAVDEPPGGGGLWTCPYVQECSVRGAVWQVKWFRRGLWGVVADPAVESVKVEWVSGDDASLVADTALVRGGFFFIRGDIDRHGHLEFWFSLKYRDSYGGTIKSGVIGRRLATPTEVPAYDEVDPAYSPDGMYLAIARNDGQSGQLLLLRDGASPLVIHRDPSNHLYRLTWSPDSRYIAYVAVDPLDQTDFPSGQVFLYDTHAGCAIETAAWASLYPYGYGPEERVFSWSADSARLLIDGSPSVWDRATGNLLDASARMTGSPQRAAISPNGRRVAYKTFAEGGREALVVFDLESGQAKVLFSDPYGGVDYGEGGAFAPFWVDDATLLTTRWRGQRTAVVLAGIDGSIVQLAFPAGPVWLSPDRERAIYNTYEYSTKVDSRVVDLTTRKTTHTIPGSEWVNSWAPDGSALFAWTYMGASLHNLTSGRSTYLAFDLQAASEPSWSADGGRIAAAHHIAGRTVVLVHNLRDFTGQRPW